MRASNEYIKIMNGQNEMTTRDVITDKYLSLFIKSQYENDPVKLDDYNYKKLMSGCFIRFENPLDFTNGRKLQYKLSSNIVTTQKLITSNNTITSENNEINFINFDDDLVAYEIYGKCEQEGAVQTPDNPSEIKTVKGIVNLFTSEMELGSILGTGELQTNSNAIRTKDYIKIKANTDYVIKNSNNYANNLYFYDINKNFISSKTSNEFISPSNARYLKVRSNASNNQNDLNTKYQIEEGDILHSYVPAGSWLKIAEEGKNLFNWNAIDHGSNVTAEYSNQEVELSWTGGFNLYLLNDNDRKFYLDKNKTYTLSFEHKGTAIAIKEDISKESILYTGTDEEYTQYSLTFTNYSSVIFDIIRRYSGNGTAYIKNFQLEKGIEVTEYEDYKENSKLIDFNMYDENNGIIGNYELCSINEIEDKFNATTGKITKRVGKLILDGSESWNRHQTGNFYPAIDLLDNIKLPSSNTTMTNMLCSHFKVDTFDNSWEQKKENTICVSADGNVNPRIQFPTCKTVDEFKTWLQANPVTIYYELDNKNEIRLSPVNLPFQKNELSKEDFDISISGVASSNGNNQKVITTYFYSAKSNIHNIKDNTLEKDLNKYADRKITALGFGGNDIMAYFDTTNYSISIVKDCEFCVSRRDIFLSDAICQGYNYPLHLATITPNISYSDDQYYSAIYARLYSIGLGKTIGNIEEEKIIGKDIDIKVIDEKSFSFTIKKSNQQSIYPNTSLFCGSNRYPMPYYTDIELHPNTSLFCGNNRYPMASNFKYIIYKYRLYYINRGGQLIDLDQYYTMSLKNDTKGLFEILTKMERS